jgi:hypothetical protein
MVGVFGTIPDNFFSPLVFSNREHYAALLLLYYKMFQENSHGLLREQVIREFTNYVSLHKNNLLDNTVVPPEDGSVVVDIKEDVLFLNAVIEEKEKGDHSDIENNDRTIANKFLRFLITTGWLSEEVQPDFSVMINITPYSRPFMDALSRVEEGLKTEYESHIVAIYSLLCGDSNVLEENGHYTVLNAHSSVQSLIDSLKVLSQSIKGHYDRFTDSALGDIRSLLHMHYDIYSEEILDSAYKRLKTSDNLSRYRPRIIKKVGELLTN